jgi:hypothetical protein
MNNFVKISVIPALLIKTKPVFKLLAISVAAAAIALLFVSMKTPRLSSVQGSEQDQNESKIQIGLDIAPVPLHFEGRNRRLVGLGSYIVNAQADCNGCHSRGPQTEYLPQGNPYLLQPPNGPYMGTVQVNTATYLGGGRDFGPIAGLTHLYSRNLTPDKTGMAAGGHTYQEFLNILRTGTDYDHVHPNCTGAPDGTCIVAPFNGDLLQVMPWPVHQNMTDHDIRAIYEYLSAIPCIDTQIAGAPYLQNECQ